MLSARRTFWRALIWGVGILIILLIAVLYGLVPWFLTNIVTRSHYHYHDPNRGKTPAAFGMAFQKIQFKSRDGILLKGWYVAAAIPKGGQPRGTIVYCHGFQRSRVELLPMAAFGHQLGYDGLLFDFRHQGESGGKISSIGYWERLDAEAAAAYALDQEQTPHPVILWGVSMGAAAALMAAAEDPRIDAVISDSTFLSFDSVIKSNYYSIRYRIRRHRPWFPALPGFPLTNEVIAWSSWRAHFNPSDFNLEKAVRRISPRPTLFVAVRGDDRMPPWIAKKLYADEASPLKQIVILPGHRHGEGFNDARAQYEQAVSQFLSLLPSKAGPSEASGSRPTRH
ncbi:MAG: alpha/beta hydrolase [Terriglobia bacterium]